MAVPDAWAGIGSLTAIRGFRPVRRQDGSRPTRRAAAPTISTWASAITGFTSHLEHTYSAEEMFALIHDRRFSVFRRRARASRSGLVDVRGLIAMAVLVADTPRRLDRIGGGGPLPRLVRRRWMTLLVPAADPRRVSGLTAGHPRALHVHCPAAAGRFQSVPHVTGAPASHQDQHGGDATLGGVLANRCCAGARTIPRGSGRVDIGWHHSWKWYFGPPVRGPATGVLRSLRMPVRQVTMRN